MKGFKIFSAFVILALCLAQLEARNAPIEQLQHLRRDVPTSRRVQNEFSLLKKDDDTDLADGTSVDGGDTTVDGGDSTVDGGDTTVDGGDTTVDGGDTTVDGGDSTDSTDDDSNSSPDPSHPGTDVTDPSNNPGDVTTDTPGDSGLSGGEIAGIVIGTLAGVAIIGGGIYYLYMKKMLCFENF